MSAHVTLFVVFGVLALVLVGLWALIRPTEVAEHDRTSKKVIAGLRGYVASWSVFLAIGLGGAIIAGAIYLAIAGGRPVDGLFFFIMFMAGLVAFVATGGGSLIIDPSNISTTPEWAYMKKPKDTPRSQA